MKIKVTALSPISHGAFTDGIDMGNILEFRRMDMVREGKHIQLPVISGNAFRGVMRRLLARELFEVLDIKNQLTGKEHDRLYAILANGGALGKDADVRVDPAAIREMREKLPLLSVFGAACYRYILQGMFSCGFLELCCKEAGTGEIPISDLISEIGEAHHIEKCEFDAENNDMKPMPYTTEVVVKGAEFDGYIDFTPHATEVERAAVYHGIKLIGYIGGKSARGYGKIKCECDCEINDAPYLVALKNTDMEFLKNYIRSTL